MKRVFLGFVILVNIIFAKEVQFSQKELLERLKPVLMEGQNYEKYKEIDARKVVVEEEIETITGDGLETKNLAKPGDYIVRNTTKAKEMYVLKSEKFEKRYVYKERLDDKWNIYKSIGEIKGVEVDTQLLEELDAPEEFYFMAPWGEKMVVKKGDYLVSPLNYSEIYRIAKKEFFETYRLREEK